MLIRRFLFLCLLTFTLGVTGPLARGLSAQAAALLQPVELTWSGTVTNLETGVESSKRCPRGAVAGSSCAFDIGYVPERREIIPARTDKIFNQMLYGASGDLSRSKLFRPPRMG